MVNVTFASISFKLDRLKISHGSWEETGEILFTVRLFYSSFGYLVLKRVLVSLSLYLYMKYESKEGSLMANTSEI